MSVEQPVAREDLNLGIIHVERKTDIIALTAFVLSLFGIAWQVAGFIEGPNVTFFPSDQVFVRGEPFDPNGPKYLRLGARMAYTNDGAEGYNTVVSKETITLVFDDGAKLEQRWQRFTTFDVVDAVLTETDRHPASPFPLEAGKAESHDTYFSPFRRRCDKADTACSEWENYVTWDDFVAHLKVAKSFTVTFKAEMLGEKKPVEKSCDVSIDQNFLERVEKNGWYSPSCWSKSTGG